MRLFKFIVSETTRSLLKWPYYAILLSSCFAFGITMIILAFGILGQQSNMMDAHFIESDRIIRFYWNNKSLNASIAALTDPSIESISMVYTRDQMALSKQGAHSLRIMHVDSAYFDLTGKRQEPDQIVLNQLYLSKFQIAEGDILFVDEKPYSVLVLSRMMDVEQQALVMDTEANSKGIQSFQCIIKVKQGAERDAVRLNIQSQLGITAEPMANETRDQVLLSYVYPDEHDAEAYSENVSNLFTYATISLIVLLYVAFQTISTARYYLNRMKREWAMLRLYCGLFVCKTKFFCETFLYGMLGTIVAWLFLPLYFRYVGSGFYVPTYSIWTIIAILPILTLVDLLLTAVTFNGICNESIAQQMAAREND